MAHITWTDDFSVGVQAIDADHKLLVSLINQLDNAIGDGEGSETIASVLNALNDYVRYHFTREEMLMEACAYPGLEKHRNEHEALRARLVEISSSYLENPGYDIGGEVLEFLSGWLTNHILGSDKLYQPGMAGKDEKITAANRAFDEILLRELRDDDDIPVIY